MLPSRQLEDSNGQIQISTSHNFAKSVFKLFLGVKIEGREITSEILNTTKQKIKPQGKKPIHCYHRI